MTFSQKKLQLILNKISLIIERNENRKPDLNWTVVPCDVPHWIKHLQSSMDPSVGDGEK